MGNPVSVDIDGKSYELIGYGGIQVGDYILTQSGVLQINQGVYEAQSGDYFLVVPTKWRADPGCGFYYVAHSGDVLISFDHQTESQNDLYNRGNYFKEEGEALLVADKINKLFKEH